MISPSFTVYDVLVEAQSFFKERAKTFEGYHQGKYWRELVEATDALIAWHRPNESKDHEG